MTAERYLRRIFIAIPLRSGAHDSDCHAGGAIASDSPLTRLAAAKFPDLTRCERAVLENADMKTTTHGPPAACGPSSKLEPRPNDPKERGDSGACSATSGPSSSAGLLSIPRRTSGSTPRALKPQARELPESWTSGSLRSICFGFPACQPAGTDDTARRRTEPSHAKRKQYQFDQWRRQSHSQRRFSRRRLQSFSSGVFRQFAYR